MVQDIRRLTLDSEEVIQALQCYGRIKANFLPEGKVTGFVILEDEMLQVNMENTETGGESSFVLPATQLVPPLVRFCIENNIMLPRAGVKSVTLRHGVVALCIALDIETYMLGNMENLDAPGYAASV